jgi:hypothetical protein
MRHISAPAIKRLGWSLVMTLAVALAALPLGAQVLYGSLVGNVQDESGAVVSGAAVTLTNKGTGQVLEATTDSEGNYSINNILPGVYDIKATKQGFATYTQTDLNVSTNNVTRVDMKMKVGNVTEVVSVEAAATALQTESATVRSELSGREINNLPIANYRNYQSLLNLVPGTTPAGFQNAVTDTPERSLTTNVNGTARNNNNTRLDGATSVNIWLPHHTAYVPPSESIQEVNIATNNFDAEQGLAGGAAVQVITKSGTNDFHGSAFAYHDNHFFRAKNVFFPHVTRVAGNDVRNPNTPKQLRTIPGATFGGPIKRDKLFFFGSWEGMYERLIAAGIMTVPTAAQRAGNFQGLTTVYDPTTGNLDGTGRAAFANNQIPTNRINPIATELLKRIPLPNLPGNNQNYFNSAPQIFDRNNYDVKVNLNRTSNHQLWWKFSHMKADVSNQFALGEAGGPALCSAGLGSCGSGTGTTKSYVGTVGHTWTLGSNFVVDGNFSVTQRQQVVTGADYGQNFGTDVLRIPGTNGAGDPDIRYSGMPAFFVSSYTGLGHVDGWSPIFRDERSYTFTQNASKIQGSHELRFGVDVVRHELNHWQPEIGAPRGSFTFNPEATALNGGSAPNQFNAFAAFLLGAPNSVNKSIQFEEMTTREWQMGFYVRDRWQVNRNLTLTLGLRYELYPIMHRRDRGIEVLDLNSPVRLIPAGQPNAGRPDGTMRVLIGGKGNNPDTLGVTSSKTMFAPRVGFAWRLGDDTVVRGGYGLTYDPMPFGRPLRGFYPLTIANTFDIRFLNPTAPAAAATYAPFGILSNQFGIPVFGGPDLSSGVVNIPSGVEMRSPYPRQLNRGEIQSWNLFVERKLLGDIKVEAGYVGTQTSNQLADLDINVAEPGGQQPLFTQYGRIGRTRIWDGWLSANYHALQVAVNRRFSKGLFIKGAYTWSKAINMTDDTGWANLPIFLSPSARHRNRALAGYDIPHNFQLGTAYELPFGKGKKWAQDGLAAAVIGNWQVNAIVAAVSGRPFTVVAPGGSLQAPGGNTQTPDLVGSVKTFEPKGGQVYFDTSAFRVVTGTPRFGTAGRNIVRGPGYGNIDLSVYRTFPITEQFRVEFRTDIFNFTNTPHYNNPSNNISAGNFGQITGAQQDERQFRFGLRLEF